MWGTRTGRRRRSSNPAREAKRNRVGFRLLLLRLGNGAVRHGAVAWIDDAPQALFRKKDGRVVFGATEEPEIRDRRPTLGGMAEPCEVALELIRRLAGALFVRAWGGA